MGEDWGLLLGTIIPILLCVLFLTKAITKN
jgi:hypothetical protein